MKNHILFASLLLLFSGCIQENPSLVNPPLVVETVNVRFLNLGADQKARTIWFDTKIISTGQPFNTVSSPEQPPFDSVTVEIFTSNDNVKTYASYNKLKFGRLSNYIMLALPNLRPRLATDTGFVNTDTLVYLQSSTLQPDDTNKCYIKFLNANPDTASNYSIKVGCPSGEHLFVDNSITTVNYLQSTGTQAIYAGSPVISIVKNAARPPADPSQPASPEVIGIFELALTPGGQYAIIVNTSDEALLFDELQPQSPPLLLTSVPERTAFVRTINLTDGPVSVVSSATGSMASGLSSNTVGAYQTVSTCNSMSLDQLELSVGGVAADTAFASFDIYRNYSLLAFSQLGGGSGLLVVPPLSERTLPRPGMATVRVANGNYTSSGLTVSTGAAAAGGGDDGYSSGIALAANLGAGECSEPVYLSAGTVPVAAFASTQPSRYLFSGIVNIEAGKDYILTFDSRAGGKIGIIESEQADVAVSFAQAAAFVQFANVTSGILTVGLSSAASGQIISGAECGSGDLLSTFLPLGAGKLQTQSSELSIDISSLEQRSLAIAAGAGDLFLLQGQSMGAAGDLRWRIINATADCPLLNVYHTERGVTTDYSNIPYKGATAVQRHNRDKKYSFVFRDAQTDKELFISQDLLMTVNKNYSIIFYGDVRTGYKIQMLQEY